jgi:hypothetical protein
MSGLLAAIAWLRKSAFWSLFYLGCALVFTTAIGGLFFNLTASVVATWFIVAMGVDLILHFLAAFTLFIIYFFGKTGGILVVFSVLVMAASWLFIAPDLTPFVELDKTLAPMLGFLDKALF